MYRIWLKNINKAVIFLCKTKVPVCMHWIFIHFIYLFFSYCLNKRYATVYSIKTFSTFSIFATTTLKKWNNESKTMKRNIFRQYVSSNKQMKT